MFIVLENTCVKEKGDIKKLRVGMIIRMSEKSAEELIKGNVIKRISGFNGISSNYDSLCLSKRIQTERTLSF